MEQEITTWAKITLVVVSIGHFHRKAEAFGVKVLAVQPLGGVINRRYRVKVKGTRRAIQRLSNY